MKQKLSVIIPVKFPSRHVQNLFEITRRCLQEGIQIIVVLDSENDSNLQTKVIDDLGRLGALAIAGNFNNPGDPRNVGLEKSHGEWIVFWDVDDSPDVARVLRAVNIAAADCELLVGDYLHFNQITGEYRKFSAKAILDNFVKGPGMWRFIFRRELIGELRFPSLPVAEDLSFLIEVLGLHPQMQIVEETLYTYHTNVLHQITKSLSRERVIESQLRVLESASSPQCEIGRDCFYCKCIDIIMWRLTLSSLTRIGIIKSIPNYGFVSARKFLISKIMRFGIKRNLLLLWLLLK